jgi:hypothetical protein
MTTLSRPTAIDTIQRREVPDCDDTQLPLKGYNPVTIYVQVTAEGVEFSTDRTQWYPDICWKCGSATAQEFYALFVTYQLLTPDTELGPSSGTDPTLYFSPVITTTIEYASTTRTQLGYIPWVAQQTTFAFSLTLGDTTVLDPQIVVTPIGGPGDGNGSTR